MPVSPASLNKVDAEIRGAAMLPPYHAVNALWLCLVKLANLMPNAGGEHEQVASMLRGFTSEQSASIVTDEAVDQLLRLQPPLETFLADRRERLSPAKATTELNRIRTKRGTDPKAALLALFEILQRIRDKREHGFKSPDGPRDAAIPGAARLLLDSLCVTAIDRLRQA